MKTAEGSADATAMLEHVYDHAAYYRMVGATVRFAAEDGHRGEFDLADAESARDNGNRRFFRKHNDKLYVDRASSNGEVTETEAWLNVMGPVAPKIVTAVEVEYEGFDDG